MRTEPALARELSPLVELGPDADTSDVLAAQFDLLADETRLRIIDALYRAERTGNQPLAFSALCDRTGVEDTGQFNYHLTRLCGSFVEKGPDGYALTPAGRAVGQLLACSQ